MIGRHFAPRLPRPLTTLRPSTGQLSRPIVLARNFPSPRQAFSLMALEMVLRRMKIDSATVHGFRSTFRDWAAECTNFPNEVCEAALAHVIENKAEAAYRRGDLFDKRRELMEAWAVYCAAPNPARSWRRHKAQSHCSSGGAPSVSAFSQRAWSPLGDAMQLRRCFY